MLQESCSAIAKMNARCVLTHGCPKNFGTPWLCPRLLFQNISWDFVPTDPMNVPTKFDVRSFTRSWDNIGISKNFGESLTTPTRLFTKNFHWFLFWWTLRMYLSNLMSVILPVLEIIGGSLKISSSAWLCSHRLFLHKKSYTPSIQTIPLCVLVCP